MDIRFPIDLNRRKNDLRLIRITLFSLEINAEPIRIDLFQFYLVFTSGQYNWREIDEESIQNNSRKLTECWTGDTAISFLKLMVL